MTSILIKGSGARGALGVLVALALGLSASDAVADGPAQDGPAPDGPAHAPGPHVLLSGVYIHGYLPGVPSLDSAVRIVNTDLDAPADIGGFALTDRFTPRKQRKAKKENSMTDDIANTGDEDPGLSTSGDPDDGGAPKPGRGRPKGNRTLRFPDKTTIPPGGEIWVAASAKGFQQIFGSPPAFEATKTDPKVPDLEPAEGFLWLNEGYGTVALLDKRGSTVDFVAFEGPKQDMFGEDAFDQVPWRGEPVMLKDHTVYGWIGRVLGRARDELGHVLPDTNKASDWPVGFSAMQLGTMPTHRVELAGQSRFLSHKLDNVQAKVLATSAPDNNYAALIAAFDTAKKELRVRVYELTNPKIAEALIKTKKRGVAVYLYLEGSPVGGIADQERWLTDRISKAGIPVHFLATPKESTQKPRYRFDHSKYVLVDDRLAIVGTENYGRTGVPVIPTFGNRGWMVHIENAEFVRQLREVWDQDYRPGVLGDVLSITASATDQYGMPYRDPKFVPSDKLPSGFYASPAKPVSVDDTMSLELVLSPDTSLNENSSIIGLIGRAKTSLILEQNSVLPFWGKKKRPDDDKRRGDDAEDNSAREAADELSRGPNLPLQAVIAAARRGVRVRVMLDGTWYNAEEEDERDNDDTVRLLNSLAQKEGLDISAKVINLESTHLEKIHAKGVIVDDKEVFVGSINWSENSFEGNREVGVIISHPKIATYYADLFRRDWSQSRLYAAATTKAVEIHEAPDAKSAVIGSKKSGERVDVVDERGVTDDHATWVEVGLGLGKTGFIPFDVLGMPEVTAHEAMYVVGRDVVVHDVIVGVRTGDKVSQLKFADVERAPFVAVVFAKDRAAFSAAGMDVDSFFIGKEVRLKGRVKVFAAPEMILSAPDQIEVVPEAPAPPIKGGKPVKPGKPIKKVTH